MSTSPASDSNIEPWLTGTHKDVPATGRAVIHALELALDDLRKWTNGLTEAEIHASPLGLRPLAVQLQHIAGSVDRILTYAEGKQLSPEQMAAFNAEGSTHESLAGLLAMIESTFTSATARVRALATGDLEAPRVIGRKQLPTSLGGALVHVADHTQRHVGQVVVTAKVLKALRT